MKTTSYAENVLALRYAHERNAAEAILANSVGELCEGTGSNVFVGVGGQLLTPPLDSGCLPGITRELLIEWLGDVVERPLPIHALGDPTRRFSRRAPATSSRSDGSNGRALPAPHPAR